MYSIEIEFVSETEASTVVTSQSSTETSEETETVTSENESTSVSTTQIGTGQSTVATEYLSTEEG